VTLGDTGRLVLGDFESRALKRHWWLGWLAALALLGALAWGSLDPQAAGILGASIVAALRALDEVTARRTRSLRAEMDALRAEIERLRLDVFGP
jgi:hypothetical protein